MTTAKKRNAGTAVAAAEAPRLRSDAQRNREELLSVAVAAYTKDANASLEGIAKKAGVGIGTLYRHYPTREALVEAAYRNEVAKLCNAAPELLKKHPADVALGRFLDRFIDYTATKKGLLEALKAVAAAGGSPFTQSRAMLCDALKLLLDAGKSAGLLREDVVVDDLLSMYGAFAAASPEQARRLAAILLDGMRRQPGTAALATKKTDRR